MANRPKRTHNPEPADCREELGALAEGLLQASLQVVWRQWGTLGAAADAGRARRSAVAPTIIDPEALLLFSLSRLGDERRLPALLSTWTALNADLLSVQRTNNLLASYPTPLQQAIAPSLVWFAGIANTVGKDARWRTLAGITSTSEVQSSDNLTLRADSAAPRAAPPKVGAVRVPFAAPAALLLRLRLAFGVGVKADLLGYLIGHADQWATVRAIADATSYRAASVRRAIEDLADAEFVRTLEGTPSTYSVATRAWEVILSLPPKPPRWVRWHSIFVFVAALVEWSESAQRFPLGAQAFASKGQLFLELHRAAFLEGDVAEWSARAGRDGWRAVLHDAVTGLAARMNELE
ncbi:MAG: hypothetical protein Q8K82_04040 [Gemmatimonadaceae bacterium]|nr:hypothetical protein [Gemmatimonadaceae bacterium]